MTKVKDSDIISCALHANETKNSGVGPSITTITWMQGDIETASAALRSRLSLVLQANPFLAGSLVKRAKSTVDIEFAESFCDTALARLFNPAGGKVPVVSASMDYAALCSAVAKTSAEILPGNSCIGNGKPLLALSVIKDSEADRSFAVVFSVSHMISDGFAYYQLLGMLSNDKDIVSLSPERKHSIVEESRTAMGLEQHTWAYSGMTLCNILGTMFFSGKALVKSYEVDDAKVGNAKAQCKEQASCGYVSTNDVLVSSFASAVSPRCLMMPMNYRNRLPSFNDRDAGNYEGVLVMGPGDYDNPALIRNSILSGPPTFTRATSRRLPSGWEALRCRIGMVTNWVFPSSFEELEVEGCTQVIHLPHSNISLVPFNVAVVYRPKRGRTAVVYFVRDVDARGLEEACPVGKEITSASTYR